MKEHIYIFFSETAEPNSTKFGWDDPYVAPFQIVSGFLLKLCPTAPPSIQDDGYYRLFEICFHFAGHRYSTQEFSAGPSEFLPDLHFLCKIVLKPSNVIPLLLF